MKKSKTLTSVFMLVVILFGFLSAPQSAAAATTCDWAQFVSDVTVPDGTTFTSGATFNKTWRLKNIGTCTWSTSYSLVFVDGTQMSAPASINLPTAVAPGSTIDLTVAMTAPTAAGTYRGNWQLKNAGGTMFGIGASANKSFWVEIKVGSGTTDTGGTGYDFVANAASATWTSGAGSLTFASAESDSGFAKKVDAPVLENGSTDTAPGLLTVPQNVSNGFIQAQYPSFKVQSGDRFQTIVNCEYNATACYVNFRLNYQIGSGAVKTFWSFSERYEGLYYRANVDLSSLAGQDVNFILYVGAAGYATGDRALWGAPRITRGTTAGVTPVPSITPGGPTATTNPGTSGCDRATFINDVNVPDGTVFSPNTAFTKTWRIKNVGTCTWTTNYTLVFVSGDKLGGPDSVKLASTVGPNTSFDVSVNLTSAATAGSYRGYWQFKNEKGQLFGIGSAANKPWWVDIVVSGSAVVNTPTKTPTAGVVTTTPPTPTPTKTVTPTPTPGTVSGVVYDFAANAGAAVWSSGAGALAFPGTDPDAKGFVVKTTSIKLEDSSTETRPSLLTVPQNVADGYIQGVFPAFAVQKNDQFQVTIGCQFDVNDCFIIYRLEYQIGDGAVSTLWSFAERYEGLTYNAKIDLSSLQGQNVKFILKILSKGSASDAGSPTNDRSLWIAPRIVR